MVLIVFVLYEAIYLLFIPSINPHFGISTHLISAAPPDDLRQLNNKLVEVNTSKITLQMKLDELEAAEVNIKVSYLIFAFINYFHLKCLLYCQLTSKFVVASIIVQGEAYGTGEGAAS